MQRDIQQILILTLAIAIILLALGVAGTLGGTKPPDTATTTLFMASTTPATSTPPTTGTTKPQLPSTTPAPPPTRVATSSELLYTFNDPGILQESATMRDSTSPYLWVNSGGELIIADNVGETMQGDTPSSNTWYAAYAASNASDTDQGSHPQNIFRLVTKLQWRDLREQALFNIVRDNFSASFNRNTSNGLLLMSRYAMGGQTLYYAGIRVDGTAVIKKKIHGVYYTMAQQQIFPGTYTGWQDDVNLIPHGEWIGLRTDTVTNKDGSVSVRLYMRRGGSSSQWVELLQATDSGQYGGTPPISGLGYAGIRTDFMDVQFRDYDLQAL